MTSKELVKQALDKWRFPILDEGENTIVIRYQMNYVSVGSLMDEMTSMAVNMRGLFNVENEEEWRYVMKTCNELNFQLMMVKLFVDTDDELVIGAEFFYKTEEDVEYLLNMALQSIMTAKKKFIHHYKAIVEEDKLLQELDESLNEQD